MLFWLSEYDRAAKEVCFDALDGLIVGIEPALAAFPRIRVDSVPTSRITTDAGTLLTPAQATRKSVMFDIARVVAGDLDCVLEELDRLASELAPRRLAYAQRFLKNVTDATGQVVRAGEVSWESLMLVIAQAPIAFDAHDQPTFVLWPPQAAAAYAALPPRTAAQENEWQALMTRKLEEHRARRGDRKLA